ncbi:uridine kinase family protein [Legionella hackeliae]|uniref:Putative Uridine-cytidine kinase B n=1 Tax=Legionella hackeliae TaxID=449 RepID=A0A0A8UR56_LEGHA|nr:hypothetical protein [Legionella hackeliae]KTD14817.1 uridine kinase [Legionella hackeliae]CEK09557.1 putative Uridine-cytidine kinase B [Legionella hackeliae]STX49467.1 uridine kinase [Legionella hackeliae]
MLFVFVAGASASGKTEIAKKIVETFNGMNIKTILIKMDDFYKSQQERGGIVEIDFDVPDAYQWVLLENQLTMLSEGKTINKPVYCFIAKNRLPHTETINPEDLKVVVVEGILALHQVHKMELPKMSLFVETDSYKTILERRKTRDAIHRATSPQETGARERRSVGPEFFKYILPSKTNADLAVTNNDMPANVLPGVKTGIDKAADEIMDKIREDHSELFPARAYSPI